MQEADYKSPLMILAALAFALGITVVGTIQLAKDRYFSEATTEYVIKIKNLLRREALVLPNEQQREHVPWILFTTRELRQRLGM